MSLNDNNNSRPKTTSITHHLTPPLLSITPSPSNITSVTPAPPNTNPPSLTSSSPPSLPNPNSVYFSVSPSMASCDDDFSLLHHHHQQHSFDPHRFESKSPPIQPPLQTIQLIQSPKRLSLDEDNYSDAAFPFDSSPPPQPPNPNPRTTTKCRDRDRTDELSDGATTKRSKSEYRVDSRKDREEWSDTAIGTLLDAYTDKFNQLNRGNLRGRDWEEVSLIVSERCDKSKNGKSVEQCKNKLDNLKKRFKVEIQRMTNAGTNVSHWVWFKKMEQIVNQQGNGSASAAAKVSGSDDDKAMTASANMLRQAKRFPAATNMNVGMTNNMKPKSLLNPRWRRVIFKISGAALGGTGSQNIDPKVALLIAREVASACRVGVEVAIVVGGRNFFCGDSWVTATGLDRPTAYQIGMMATVMNSILLQSALEKLGVQTRVQTAFAMQEIAEPYSKRRAIRHLEKGRVVIFGGIGAGTGNPLFTTDTAAALRASEINADAILKGTNVDGVFDCHSRNNSNVPFEHISFGELVSRGVTSVDTMAVTFCQENGIPVVVFNLHEPGNISRALCGDQIGTLIDKTGSVS